MINYDEEIEKMYNPENFKKTNDDDYSDDEVFCAVCGKSTFNISGVCDNCSDEITDDFRE